MVTTVKLVVILLWQMLFILVGTLFDDNVTIGGLTGVHQFVRIGKGAMIGGAHVLFKMFHLYVMRRQSCTC